MLISDSLAVSILSFALTIILMMVLRRPAHRFGLIDKPNARKRHRGTIPLIGGIAMFIPFAFSFLFLDGISDKHYGLLVALSLLMLTGIKDDRHDLKAPVRFIAQAGVALVLVWTSAAELRNLGDLFGAGAVIIYHSALPFTVFCMVGVINALNMSDGLDGLAGGIALIAVFWLLAATGFAGYSGVERDLLTVLGAVLLGFLYFNLRRPGRKRATVFMGDAGSMMLGLLLAWFMIDLSQSQGEQQAALKPITAVWILGLPLLDTVSIMIQRVLKRRSPFAADRQHLHHILLGAGFSHAGTTAIMLLVSFVLGAAGVAGAILQIPEYVMFYVFLGLFAVYFFMLYGKRSSALRLERNES